MQPSEEFESQEALGFRVGELQAAARTDLDLFGALCCPDDCTLSFPNFYKALWVTLYQAMDLTRDFSKFAIGFPRGHAKTFWLKLLIVATILFTKKRFILIVCAVPDLAEKVLGDVVDILDSDNVQSVFGNWRVALEVDRQDEKVFTFCGRSIILKGVGHGTAMRGIARKNKRPDLILCDDAQTKDCAESEVESKKFLGWFFGTLLKAKAPDGCTYVYVGNMYKDMESEGE